MKTLFIALLTLTSISAFADCSLTTTVWLGSREESIKVKLPKPLQAAIESKGYVLNKRHGSISLYLEGDGFGLHAGGYLTDLNTRFKKDINALSVEGATVVAPSNQLILEKMNHAKDAEEYRKLQLSLDPSLNSFTPPRGALQVAIESLPTCKEFLGH